MTGGAPILVLDAHAHFHACYDAGTFLDTAARRLARAAAGRPATLYLLLAGVRGRDPLEGWRGSPPGCRAWSLASTAEEDALLASRRDGGTLVLVRGRQIACAEGIEVLAFGGEPGAGDGEPFEEVVAAALRRSRIVVVPWGFGKWRGERGAAVLAALRRHGDRVHLGDTAGRPPFDPGRAVFARAGGHAARRLFGSDPLPFPDHAAMVARCGTIVPGRTDPVRPLASLAAALEAARTFVPFGEGPGLLRFTRDQFRLRVRRPLRGRPGGD